ncbi:MAG: C39 family peptidase [Verrucomicrobiota bacterium]
MEKARFFPGRSFVVLLVLAAIPPAFAVQLKDFVLDQQEWSMTTEAFEKEFEDQGFEWTSSAKNVARHPGRTHFLNKKTEEMEERRPKIGEVEVGETLIKFVDGEVNRVEVYAYNRGDDGDIREHQFEEKVEMYTKLISKLTGARPQERNTAREKGLMWSGKTAMYLLEYSATRASRGSHYRAEYVKLSIAPKRTGLASIGRQTVKKAVDRSSLRKNVQEKDNGDVVIPNVPMVDQGAKGYCAVAASCRVLQYYGLDVTQHELAQTANTTAYGGTNPDEMMDALKKISGKYGVRVSTIDEVEPRDLIRIIKDYNRTAKKVGAMTVREPSEYYLSYGIFGEFDSEALSTSRSSSTSYKRFKSEIREHVDQGIPLLWSLMLGVIPEKNIPQLAGGHLRLIIGYNEETDEIIFSDSWGAGHEEKRMSTADAYAATTSLRMIKPGR